MKFRRGSLVLAVLVVCSLAIALPVRAQTETVNLTSKFMQRGVKIDHLLVYKIGGVVVMRGTAPNKAGVEQAASMAKKMGYRRVANLIQIAPPIDDAWITRSAERQLAMQRGLEGCTFHIESRQGIVRLRGRIHQDMQRDMALQTIRRIEGVKEVREELTKS